MIRVREGALKDEEERVCMFRGFNVGGSSKVPVKPKGASEDEDGFFDYKNVSFTGRPFPAEEAKAHWERLKSWGADVVRLIVTWEAVEHAGPGIYDLEYLSYLADIAGKAAEAGIHIIIDPHQDVWSRWTGGDGAPAWTLEAAGMNIRNLHETGAAVVRDLWAEEDGGPFPKMIWPSNYGKLGCATMFTLFFGGDVFAPHLAASGETSDGTETATVTGESIQRYLQLHYIQAFIRVAEALRGLPNILGYGTMNEPHPGFIGCDYLESFSSADLRLGISPTPLEAMYACAGNPVKVRNYIFSPIGLFPAGRAIENPNAVRLWAAGRECPWRRQGVWDIKNRKPVLLKPGYFTEAAGKRVRFTEDFLKPFLKRFYVAIKKEAPDALVFMEGCPNRKGVTWNGEDGRDAVHAAHWYDVMTLMTKRHTPWLGFDAPLGKPVLGRKRVALSFSRQLGRIKGEHGPSSGVPVIIGETGVPFDLNKGKSFLTGDYSCQERALSVCYDALDSQALSCLLWNYSADNTYGGGDDWNGEDLSVFSKGEGRGLKGFVRPYPRRIAGRPGYMRFDTAAGIFEFAFEPDPSIRAQTEIFIPRIQYPAGYIVEAGEGVSWTERENSQLLFVRCGPDCKLARISVKPSGR